MIKYYYSKHYNAADKIEKILKKHNIHYMRFLTSALGPWPVFEIQGPEQQVKTIVNAFDKMGLGGEK